MDIENKVVWITGASSGIGEALARSLAERGCRLILSSRREEELNRVRDSLARDKRQVMVLPLDLSEGERLKDKSIRALSFFGRIDVLINNAGISQRSLAEETDLAVDRLIMEIDYFGQIALTKYVLPSMLELGGGHIVVVSSIMGKIATPLRSSYCAAKHALHGFYDALRAEVFDRNVKVTLVCPAAIRTDISIHSVTGDGTPYGKMDDQQAKGLSARACAELIIEAVQEEKEEVLIGPRVRHVATIRRFFPGLYSRLVRRAKVT